MNGKNIYPELHLEGAMPVNNPLCVDMTGRGPSYHEDRKGWYYFIAGQPLILGRLHFMVTHDVPHVKHMRKKNVKVRVELVGVG